MNSEESYYDGRSVFMIDYATHDLLVASLCGETKFQVVDRRVRKFVREIRNPTMDTSYNSIQRVFNSCRYLIAKDS